MRWWPSLVGFEANEVDLYLVRRSLDGHSDPGLREMDRL